MTIRAVVLLALFCTGAAPLSAQQPAPEGVYEGLLQQLKSSGSVDFDALRRAYADSPLYDPYNFDLAEWEDSVFSYVADGNARSALRFVDRILAANYLYPAAHLGASIAYDALADSALAQYHQGVLSGLINSIAASGSGDSPETPVVVMFVAEEYAYLGAAGLQHLHQALTRIGDVE